jgi:hypothetical protein
VPTLVLLDRLFTSLASEPVGHPATTTTTTELPPGGDGGGDCDDVDVPLLGPAQETEIHLQDYNRSVLELVTFPNVLLAWCPSLPSRFPRELT